MVARALSYCGPDGAPKDQDPLQFFEIFAPMYGPAGLGSTVATLGILPANLAPRFGKGGTIAPFAAGSGERTVRAHLSSIYAKLDVDSRALAVAVSLERGLLSHQE